MTAAAKDAPWWDDYMLSGPFTSALAFSKAPGANEVWLTNYFGAVRGSLTSDGSPAAFNQEVKGLEEVVVFDIKAPPRAAGGPPLLTATADVDGFVHAQGLDAAPRQLCAAMDRGSCAFLQEDHSLDYCRTCVEGCCADGLQPGQMG
jgi:hypothetical protein